MCYIIAKYFLASVRAFVRPVALLAVAALGLGLPALAQQARSGNAPAQADGAVLKAFLKHTTGLELPNVEGQVIRQPAGLEYHVTATSHALLVADGVCKRLEVRLHALEGDGGLAHVSILQAAGFALPDNAAACDSVQDWYRLKAPMPGDASAKLALLAFKDIRQALDDPRFCGRYIGPEGPACDQATAIARDLFAQHAFDMDFDFTAAVMQDQTVVDIEGGAGSEVFTLRIVLMADGPRIMAANRIQAHF